MNSFCDVHEEDHRTKKSYQACWISQVLETRPQYRQTLTEKNCIGKVSYEQQQVVHFIVERNMNHTLKLSCSNEDITEHLLPLPRKKMSLAKDENTSEPSKQQIIMKNLHNQSTSGGAEPTKSTQADFGAVNLMSSSHISRGQKRE